MAKITAIGVAPDYTLQTIRDLALNLRTAETAKVTASWGDGTSSSYKPMGGITHPEHLYEADGIYRLTLTASGTGSTMTRNYNVVVDATPDQFLTNEINGTRGNDIAIGTNSYYNLFYLGTGNDLARGGSYWDYMVGGAGNDTLYGGASQDNLQGGVGNDLLFGGHDNDLISGGAGNDTLSGGQGPDVFVFDAALNAKTNVDRIIDFSHADDTIHLSRSKFGGITKKGVLNPAAFHIGKQAHDKDDRIIYDKATGALYYDRDGTGAGSAVKFAQVDKGVKITHDDFFMV